MKQEIYIYYFKADTKCEALGRVMATSLGEARELISEKKALDANIISELFVIKKLEDHENNIQPNIN
jgi:hypothetical protein